MEILIKIVHMGVVTLLATLINGFDKVMRDICGMNMFNVSVITIKMRVNIVVPEALNASVDCREM